MSLEDRVAGAAGDGAGDGPWSGFRGDVVVQEDGPRMWVLREQILYHGNIDLFTVPLGFRTDFASVPRPFVWLIPQYGAYTKAAILHDYLCAQGVLGRSDADGIFRRSMYDLGVPFLRRWIMWAAVRAGSRLRGAGVLEVLVWLCVALPAAAFVAAPALMILVWLAFFWLIEFGCYHVLRPFSRKEVHRPRFLVRMS